MAYFRDFKNIVIQGPPAHEKAVLEQLDKLWNTWTGWAVLRGVIDTGKTVTIVPFTKADEKAMGDHPAYARAKSGLDAAPRGVVPFKGREDDPLTEEDERYDDAWFPGTGNGSDSEIHYSPKEVHHTCIYRETATGPCLYLFPPLNSDPNHSDALLVHELTHSLREMRGQFNQIPTRNPRNVNEEEYFALLMQNIYDSEKGFTYLRAEYTPTRLMDKAEATSEAFLGKGKRPVGMRLLDNRRLVMKFTLECAELCRNIMVHVQAKFNPIGEYLRNPREYPYDPKLAFPVKGRPGIP
jgi:hypothetical protein